MSLRNLGCPLIKKSISYAKKSATGKGPKNPIFVSQNVFYRSRYLLGFKMGFLEVRNIPNVSTVGNV